MDHFGGNCSHSLAWSKPATQNFISKIELKVDAQRSMLNISPNTKKGTDSPHQISIVIERLLIPLISQLNYYFLKLFWS